MAWLTRQGTRVLHPRAAHMASIYEIYHDAAEYKVYKSFDEHLLVAEDGDRLLVYPIEDTPYECLQGCAHVLNITNGTSGIVEYETMSHCIKPVEKLLTLV